MQKPIGLRAHTGVLFLLRCTAMFFRKWLQNDGNRNARAVAYSRRLAIIPVELTWRGVDIVALDCRSTRYWQC